MPKKAIGIKLERNEYKQKWYLTAMKYFALIVLNDFCLKQICNDTKKKLKFMSTHKTCKK